MLSNDSVAESSRASSLFKASESASSRLSRSSLVMPFMKSLACFKPSSRTLSATSGEIKSGALGASGTGDSPGPPVGGSPGPPVGGLKKSSVSCPKLSRISSSKLLIEGSSDSASNTVSPSLFTARRLYTPVSVSSRYISTSSPSYCAEIDPSLYPPGPPVGDSPGPPVGGSPGPEASRNRYFSG